MTCPRPECGAPSDPRSTKGYCTPHKHEARGAWKAKVAASADERAEREERWALLHEEAVIAGKVRAEACVPVPMVVTQHASPLDDESRIEQAWYVPQGVCGHAWVTIRPGNCSFAVWAKKHANARKAYYGGVEIWIGAYGQSMEMKEAYARGYADVLREAGIKAYAGSRMD